MFFVATAPSGEDGHVNLSPKGLDTFRVLDPTDRRLPRPHRQRASRRSPTCARTAGITFMFCAFEGPPRIVRLLGRGEAVRVGDAGATSWPARFPDAAGRPVGDPRRPSSASPTRAATRCRRWRSSATAPTLIDWAERQGDDGLVDYRAEKNAASIDGLPGLADAADRRSLGPMFADRMDRVRAAHGRGRRRRPAAVGRARPALADRATRRCRSSASRCSSCPRDGDATLVVPRLEAPRVVERPDLFGLRAWDETDDPVAIVADLLGAAGAAAIGDRTWARFLVDLQAPLPGHVRWRRASEVIGPLRAVKDPAEVDALRAAAAAADRVAAELQGGEIPLVGRTEAAGVGRHRPAAPRRGPPPGELRHRRRRPERGQPAPRGRRAG